MEKKSLIYLEDAIDAILHKLGVKDESCLLPSEKAIVEALEDMPQQEIIRCKDCIYYSPLGLYGASGYCLANYQLYFGTRKLHRCCLSCDFCSWGIGRETQFDEEADIS